jgi:hypothetical protein
MRIHEAPSVYMFLPTLPPYAPYPFFPIEQGPLLRIYEALGSYLRTTFGSCDTLPAMHVSR